MTNLYEQQPCERFAPMISAMVDGELERESEVQLDDHLDSCETCRQRLSTYHQIDAAIFSDADVFTNDEPKVVLKHSVDSHSKLGIGSAILRWVPLAVAATVLVGLMMTALLPSSRSTVTAEQIAQPLAELEMIDLKHRENRARMLKTIELDLRALTVELNQLNDTDEKSEEEQRLADHLDQLVERVTELGLESN